MVPYKNLTLKPAQSSWTKITEHYFLPAIILLLAASAVSFYAIFGTTYQAFRAGRGSVDVTAAALKVDDADKRLSELKKRTAEIENISKTDLQRIDLVLPSGPSRLETLVHLEALTGDMAVDVKNFSFAPGAAVAGSVVESETADDDAKLIAAATVADSVSISFSVVDYEDLKRAVAVLQQNMRLMDINSLTYDPKSGEVAVTLTAYHLP